MFCILHFPSSAHTNNGLVSITLFRHICGSGDDTVSCLAYESSVIHERLSTEHWWNDTDWEDTSTSRLVLRPTCVPKTGA